MKRLFLLEDDLSLINDLSFAFGKRCDFLGSKRDRCIKLCHIWLDRRLRDWHSAEPDASYWRLLPRSTNCKLKKSCRPDVLCGKLYAGEHGSLRQKC